MLDWKKAEEHLYNIQNLYKSIGFTGAFALSVTIRPLVKRFESGERTTELYDEIVELE